VPAEESIAEACKGSKEGFVTTAEVSNVLREAEALL